MFLSWLPQLPLLLALLVVLYLPGYVLVSAVNRRHSWFIRLAQAPAWTAGVVGILSVAYGLSGIPWTLATALGGLLAAAVVGYGAQMLRRRLHLTDPQAVTHAPGWQSVVCAVVFGLVAGLPIMVMTPVTGLIQGSDAQYHMSILWHLVQDGNASPLTANAPLMGLEQLPTYYPTAWHAIVSLVMRGQAGVAIATNIVLIATPIVFVFSIQAFTWAVTRDRAVTLWAAGTSALVPIALVKLQLIAALWPFVAGMAIVPGVMAALVADVTLLRQRRRSDQAWAALTYFVPILGLFFFHPSTLLPAVVTVWVACLAYVVWQLWKIARHWAEPASDRLPRIGAYLGALYFLIVTPYLIFDSPLARILRLSYVPKVSWADLPTKVIYTFTMYSPGGGIENFIFYSSVAVVSLAAVWTVWRQRRYRLLVIGWCAQVLLVLACYIPMPIFNTLTSLYYNVPTRAQVGAAIFLVPIFAVAASTWEAAIRRRRQTAGGAIARGIPVAVFVVASAITFPATAQAAHKGVYPAPTDERYLADAGELAMIARAKQLPKDARVIGDPAIGASLIEVGANRHVVWPHRVGEGAHNEFMKKHFNEITYNPHVCRLVRQYGITHFYEDKPRFYNSVYTEALRPGMYNVNTKRGFTLIDQGGSAKLYRIDMCNDPDWRYDTPPLSPWQERALTPKGASMR